MNRVSPPDEMGEQWVRTRENKILDIQQFSVLHKRRSRIKGSSGVLKSSPGPSRLPSSAGSAV